MPEPTVTIAVTMACFNRRETTLRCLRSLMLQASPSVRLSVHLMDDASPDGTAQAVRAAFPQVNIIDGDGHRFWGGGMYLATRSALQGRFDYLLWLNDDVALKPDALIRMLAAHDATIRAGAGALNVIVGAMEDPETGNLSYGGFDRRSRWHPLRLDRIGPDLEALTPCDTLNGNCVLIPLAVIDRIGTIDPTFVHQLGDIDYGFRLVRAGGRAWLAPGFIGACEPNHGSTPWRKRGLTLSAKLRLLRSPRGLPPKPWLTFMWRWGKIPGVAALLWTYLLALFTTAPEKDAVAV